MVTGFRVQHNGMSPLGIIVGRGLQPWATMIPRGDIPLCCKPVTICIMLQTNPVTTCIVLINIYIGVVLVPGAIIGQLLGGLIAKCNNLGVKGILWMVVSYHVLCWRLLRIYILLFIVIQYLLTLCYHGCPRVTLKISYEPSYVKGQGHRDGTLLFEGTVISQKLSHRFF